MFIIYAEKVGKYFCKDHTKVIVFDTPDEAAAFAQSFCQYSTMMGMEAAFEAPSIFITMQEVLNSIVIKELPAQYEFEIINFKDYNK